jgi:hypothetical protein
LSERHSVGCFKATSSRYRYVKKRPKGPITGIVADEL